MNNNNWFMVIVVAIASVLIYDKFIVQKGVAPVPQPAPIPVQSAPIDNAPPPAQFIPPPVNDAATRQAEAIDAQVRIQQTNIALAQTPHASPTTPFTPTPALFDVITCERTTWLSEPLDDTTKIMGYIAHATKLSIEGKSPNGAFLKVYTGGAYEMWIPSRSVCVQ